VFGNSKNKVYYGFTSKYEINKLVYYEEYQWVHDAIAREKAIKRWIEAKENRSGIISKSIVERFE